MNSLFASFVFLSLFCVIGGTALGSVVRNGLRHNLSCNSLFFVIWGGLFAGVPLLMGYGLFVPHGAVHLFGIQLGLLIGAICIVAFVPDWFLESFDAPKILPVAFGGLFLLIGVVAGVALIGSEPFSAFVFFLAFGGIGGSVFVFGLREALKS